MAWRTSITQLDIAATLLQSENWPGGIRLVSVVSTDGERLSAIQGSWPRPKPRVPRSLTRDCKYAGENALGATSSTDLGTTNGGIEFACRPPLDQASPRFSGAAGRYRRSAPKTLPRTSVRSAFERFRDLLALSLAVAYHALARGMTRAEVRNADAGRQTRLRSQVETRVEICERWLPLWRALLHDQYESERLTARIACAT